MINTLTILYLVGGLSLFAVVFTGYLLHRVNTIKPPENIEDLQYDFDQLDAQINAVGGVIAKIERLDRDIEEQRENFPDPDYYTDKLNKFEEQILEGYKGDEFVEKVRSLERQFAELHEFVNRNLKKMSTRAQRAEMLEEVLNQSKEVDEAQTEMFQHNHHQPNGRGRLMRKPRR